MKEKITIDADFTGALYGTGFLLAAGMRFAENGGEFLNAFLHGFLSWAYVGYWLVNFLN